VASNEYDVLVVGAGPGGYVAAIRAAQLGLSTALVERDDRLGGTCLLRGCIPTKAMLHAADLLTEIQGAKRAGIKVGGVEVDFAGVMKSKEQAVTKNSKGVEFLMKKNKIEVIQGQARLVGPGKLAVESNGKTRELSARRGIILANGSRPREIGAFPTDAKQILNSDHMLQLTEIPSRLAVLGAGAVGVEFASVFARFGSEVTLIEMLPRIVPLEDEEVSAELEKSFKKQGIKVRTGTTLESAQPGKSGVRLQLVEGDAKEELEVDVLLVAVGRAPNSEDAGLEESGVKLEKGYVVVDEFMRTSVPGVYAIGDLVPTPWLAHTASAEGIVAAEHIAGAPTRPLDYDKTPGCTYCHPEVASVGLTEAQAREEGYEVAVGKFPWAASGKARILNETTGFVKLVRETRYDEILGIHIIGPHATDLIGEACALIGLESTNEELGRIVHPHPTLTEAMMEASHDAAGHALGM
jgi:dihydrolipoamide dehydrogenase